MLLNLDIEFLPLSFCFCFVVFLVAFLVAALVSAVTRHGMQFN